MADEEKAKQSLSGVRFGTKHSYDDFGLVLQKKDLSLPEPKTEKIEVTGRNGGTDYVRLDCSRFSILWLDGISV